MVLYLETKEKNERCIQHRSCYHCPLQALQTIRNHINPFKNKNYLFTIRIIPTSWTCFICKFIILNVEENHLTKAKIQGYTISMLFSIDCQLSLISYVVLQLFPTSAAHRAGVSTPHSIRKIVNDQ